MRACASLDASPADAAPDGAANGHAAARLSTDYLNRYAEVAMTLTQAVDDPDSLAALEEWRATTYPEHFARSGLRHAASVIAAYEALPAATRRDFDAMTESLNRLAEVAIAGMAGATDRAIRATLAEISATALSHHIARLAAFLNANGAEPLPDATGDIRAAVDEVLAMA